MAEETTGELLLERRLDHESGEAHTFYRNLQGPVRVGIEATGPIRWFERLLAELGHELWETGTDGTSPISLQTPLLPPVTFSGETTYK